MDYRSWSRHIDNFQQAAFDKTLHAAQKIDAWVAESPYQAAAAGAVIGLATTIVFNKVLAIKGVFALTSCVYGTAKGAVTGYAYPAAREQTIKGFAIAVDGLTKAQTATSQTMDDLYRRGQGFVDRMSQAAMATFG